MPALFPATGKSARRVTTRRHGVGISGDSIITPNKVATMGPLSWPFTEHTKQILVKLPPRIVLRVTVQAAT